MTTRPLSDPQLMRYSRHIMLPSLDIDGQEAIWNSRVLILGMGGLGCAVAQYLTASGVGHLCLSDDDIVDATNLQRQVLHHEVNVGLEKVESAKYTLMAINSEIDISTINKRLTENELLALVENYDLVIDCSDNLAARNRFNRVCFQNKTPLVSGSAIRLEGQVSTFLYQDNQPCYHCLSQFISEQNLTCSEAGILSPVVGLIGSIQATEALKVLTGVGETITGRLLLIDAATMSFNSFKINQNQQCEVCGI